MFVCEIGVTHMSAAVARSSVTTSQQLPSPARVVMATTVKEVLDLEEGLLAGLQHVKSTFAGGL